MSEIGNLLRSAREKRNVTLDEVAAATCIKVTYLDALEQGNYNALPGPAYVTGFLRNYARYLGLHPDDVVQDYYAVRPIPQPTVKAATRVLADGYHRYNRTRLLSGFILLVLLLGAGYAVKQYNDTYAAHPYATQLNVTPANLGAAAPAVRHPAAAPVVRLRLRALMPVWVRVTVDGQRDFEGILRVRSPHAPWVAHHSIYVVTYDGTHLRGVYDGRPLGRLSSRPGLFVGLATSSGWHPVS